MDGGSSRRQFPVCCGLEDIRNSRGCHCGGNRKYGKLPKDSPQRALFSSELGLHRLLFVSRYPQSTDLRSWLCSIPNHYIHFGDFDLAGINIFLTEFHAHLGERSSFLIPKDIEQRLANNGTGQRYNAQYQKFKNLATHIPALQNLIDAINKYRRGYDQEGYISI